ncbi:hypothetical protein TSUD_03180 [Trifolium subterraneum]|nr:hypothetical protein TSUD_03180 [Trifolium subterraneum]
MELLKILSCKQNSNCQHNTVYCTYATQEMENAINSSTTTTLVWFRVQSDRFMQAGSGSVFWSYQIMRMIIEQTHN